MNAAANEFITSLQDNSQELMQTLKIPAERYEMFAKLAVGIAEKESEFDRDTFTKYNIKENFPLAVDFYKWWNDDKSAHSSGLTQIKIGDWQDKQALEYCKQFGVDEKTIWNPDKSAIATIILLNSMYNYEVKRGSLKQNIQELDLTDEQALLYLWNDRSQIRNKTATPAYSLYIKDVQRNYKNFEFEIVE